MTTLSDAEATYFDALEAEINVADAHDASINAQIEALRKTKYISIDPSIDQKRMDHKRLSRRMKKL